MSKSILPNITKRWSPRAFSSKSISEEDLDLLFKAAGKAASSYNEQPWRFVYAHREDTQNFNLLLECLTEFNQKWAKNAAVLVATVAKKSFSNNGKPNAHSWHDIGLAMGNLSLQATSMDIYLHHMAGYDKEKTIESLNIRADYEPVTFVAIGYLGDKEQLPDNLKEQETPESPRKDVDEITFVGQMGK
ncbi:nitroreductase family protein [Bernardetia sp.]|uniref:nitroreductase family protein n=1 Tax=Bernardetia sp. TaxID=1937974 RepID=UPI0025BE5A83|nr:nitroreductase family protein [Bernardetia sp.]